MNTTAITQTIVLPASPEKIYAGFTNPAVHTKMTGGAEATGGAAIGDEFTAWDGYIYGTVLDLEPNKRIVQEWQATDWPTNYPPSRLEILLAPHADGTELTLTHTALPTESAESYGKGWQEYYWKPMKKYFGHK